MKNWISFVRLHLLLSLHSLMMSLNQCQMNRQEQIELRINSSEKDRLVAIEIYISVQSQRRKLSFDILQFTNFFFLFLLHFPIWIFKCKQEKKNFFFIFLTWKSRNWKLRKLFDFLIDCDGHSFKDFPRFSSKLKLTILFSIIYPTIRRSWLLFWSHDCFALLLQFLPQ